MGNIIEYLIKLSSDSAALGELDVEVQETLKKIEAATEKATEETEEFKSSWRQPIDTTQISEAVGEIGEMAGKTGEAAAELGAMLETIFPGAEELGATIAALAGTVVVVTEKFAALEAVLGASTLPVLGAAAVALASVKTAHLVLANAASTDTEFAKESALAFLASADAAEKLADTLRSVKDAHRETSWIYQDTSIKLAVLKGELTDYEAAAIKASTKVREGANAERDALRESLRLTQDRLSAANDILSIESATAEEHAAAQKTVNALTPEVARLRGELENLNSTTDAQAGELANLIIQQGQAKEAAEAQALAEKLLEEARRRHTAMLAFEQDLLDIVARGYTDQEKAAYEAAKQIAELEAKAAELGVSYEKLLPAIQQINLELKETQAAEALKTAMEEVRMEADQGAAFLQSFQDQLAQLVPQQTLSELDTLIGLEADLVIAFSRGIISVEAYNTALQKLKETREQLSTGEKTPVEGATTVVATANAGSSAVMGAVSQAGPWGALIAMLVELVQNFADVGDIFNDFTISFNRSLAELPATLGENLQYWLESGTQSAIDLLPNFVSNLAEGLPEILEGIVHSIPTMAASFIDALLIELPRAAVVFALTLADPNTWIDVIAAFVQGLVEGIQEIVSSFFDVFGKGEDKKSVKESVKGWAEDTWDNAKGVFTGAKESLETIFGGGTTFVGSFDTGTDYVNRTGMALVHQGERIIPASGASSGRSAQVMGGGGETHLHIESLWPPSPGQVEQMVRELGRHLGTQNRRLSWPSGS